MILSPCVCLAARVEYSVFHFMNSMHYNSDLSLFPHVSYRLVFLEIICCVCRRAMSNTSMNIRWSWTQWNNRIYLPQKSTLNFPWQIATQSWQSSAEDFSIVYRNEFFRDENGDDKAHMHLHSIKHIFYHTFIIRICHTMSRICFWCADTMSEILFASIISFLLHMAHGKTAHRRKKKLRSRRGLVSIEK